MATALRLTGGEDVEETAKFVEFFDKFFDCRNVGDFDSGLKARNPFKDPYHSGSDSRLKVCGGCVLYQSMKTLNDISFFYQSVARERLPGILGQLGGECRPTSELQQDPSGLYQEAEEHDAAE